MGIICLLGTAIGFVVFSLLRRASRTIRWIGAIVAALIIPVVFATFIVLNGDPPPPGAQTIDPGEWFAVEAQTPPEGASAELERVKPLLEAYTRLRLDATGFANGVAGFWFLESQRAGKYFIFGVQSGSELRSERTGVTPDGKEILTVWFPASPEYAQVTIDMCNAYNSDMVELALDLARNGDFETALCICRQIRKVLPDLESCYPWDEMEKDLVNRNADLQYPYTRKGRLPSDLSRAFFEFGGYVAGAREEKGGSPQGMPEEEL
jgi:hypothetical protein